MDDEMEMTNLWEETVRVLNRNGLDFDKDVIQVQTAEGYIDKELFKMMAMAIYYDSGYGSAEIREDLTIVGEGWWLERDEYDGSEWWAFCATPALLENNAGAPKLTTYDYEEEE